MSRSNYSVHTLLLRVAMHRKLLIAALAASGCTSINEPFEVGKDTYMMTARSWTPTLVSHGTLLGETMRKAAAFCREKNQKLSMQNQRNDGNAFSGNRDEEVVFQCLPETDPDYQRPDILPQPNHVEEMRIREMH